jgi:hypothetical protein
MRMAPATYPPHRRRDSYIVNLLSHLHILV